MTTVRSMKRTLLSKKGQSLIELTLLTPLMLLMVYGVVEVGSVISTYLQLTHTTREGANLISRGTPVSTALVAIRDGAAPTIRTNNLGQWRIIYTEIVQDGTVPCPPPQPCTYKVNNHVIQGSLGQLSKLGGVGTIITPSILPGIENIGPSQKFDVIEVYYDYGPNAISWITKNIDKLFYDRTIFTRVSGKV